MEGDRRGLDDFFECWHLALSSCPCFCIWIYSQSLNHSAEDRLGETQSRGESGAALCALSFVGISCCAESRISRCWTCSWLEFQSRARLYFVGTAIIWGPVLRVDSISCVLLVCAQVDEPDSLHAFLEPLWLLWAQADSVIPCKGAAFPL